jgi:enoyl-CoA hydratase/carnithine racemase
MELKVTKYEIIDNGVATVWLHRPGGGNSWSGRMNAELRWIMAALDDDPTVRVVVLTGSGDQFCVGADTKALDFYKETDQTYGDTLHTSEMATPGHGAHPQFDHDRVWQWGMRVPIIAAINGACAGIAASLASFCDLRYAAEGSKFTTAAPRLGLPAEYGIAWILPRLVGVTHAADILITGRIVLAEELLQMGTLMASFRAARNSHRRFTKSHLRSPAESPQHRPRSRNGSSIQGCSVARSVMQSRTRRA